MSKLATRTTSSKLNKLERKISGQEAIASSEVGAVRSGKGFTLFISNEDMDDVAKIVESLKKITSIN